MWRANSLKSYRKRQVRIVAYLQPLVFALTPWYLACVSSGESVPAAIGLGLLAICTAYISQPSHVVMSPPRKKVCRIALSLSLRVFILCVNAFQKPSATRLTEMRTKALLLKLRGDSLSTESSPGPQTVVLLQLIGPYSLRNPSCGFSADSSNVLSSVCL